MKLCPKKTGKGYISSFTVNISLNEAKACGFLDETCTPYEIEKIVDTGNKTITIKLK